MILVRASFEILQYLPSQILFSQTDKDKLGFDLEVLEEIGRVCYKSENKIASGSAKPFIENIIKRGHESIIEHSAITVKFIVDRGVSHELVRHRIASFSQENTRYCNYKGGVTFIIPPWVDISEGSWPTTIKNGFLDIDRSYKTIKRDTDHAWFWAMVHSEGNYKNLLAWGWTPQQARSILPNSLKTEVVCTANLREWRHILKLRTDNAAHPQMQEIMRPLLKELKRTIPIIFDDII